MRADDRGWLTKQVKAYARLQPTYRRLAERLGRILEAVARRYCPGALVQGREKSIASFAEKALRKRDKYADPVHQLTDLAGARLVTYTADEAEAVCRFIDDERDGSFAIDRENSVCPAARLKVGEFGYGASHFIVQLKQPEILGVEVEPELLGLKAEIQICTMLQHVWATIDHDRVYKAELVVPASLERELARVAALLEMGDGRFSEAVRSLDAYVSFDTYLPPDKIEEAIARWQAVHAVDPHDETALHQLGRLFMSRQDWTSALRHLAPLATSPRSAVLCDLGRAAWRAGRLARGRRWLRQAIQIDRANRRALCEMGRSYLRDDPGEALPWFEKALLVSPDEPRALAPYLECKVRLERSLRPLSLARQVLGHAAQECDRRADLGVYLPEAHRDRGRLELYAEPKEPYRSLHSYAKAVAASHGSSWVRAELAAITEMIGALSRGERGLPAEAQGFEWVRRLLVLGVAARERGEPARSRGRERRGRRISPETRALLEAIATPAAERPRFVRPVVIVVGGCDVKVEAELRREFEVLLDRAFADFDGTIVCGGTKAGVSGLVGDLVGLHAKAVFKVGYLPAQRFVPAGDLLHPGYAQICRTAGRGYTPLGPLQTWADLLLSGVDPGDVHVVGVNGGLLSAFEYRLALALGAKVGILVQSGRAASELLPDADWSHDGGLVPLPRDWATLSAFVKLAHPGAKRLPRATLDRMAVILHEGYRPHADALRKVSESMLSWKQLPEVYRKSSRAQAAFSLLILRAAGYEVAPAPGGPAARAAAPPGFERKAAEMAEREHGRYTAERLVAGWRRGPRDPAKRTNPTLVPWDELPEGEREHDYTAVRSYPAILALAGLTIVPRPPGERAGGGDREAAPWRAAAGRRRRAARRS